MPASPDEVHNGLEDILRMFKEIPTRDRERMLANHCTNLIHYKVADQTTVLSVLSQMVVSRDAQAS